MRRMRAKMYAAAALSVMCVFSVVPTKADTPLPEESARQPVNAPAQTAIRVHLDARVASGARTLEADLHVPVAGNLRPVVILWHGPCRDRSEFARWAAHLATWGFITIAPTSRATSGANAAGTCAPVRRVDWLDILDVADWARTESARPGSPLHRKVDLDRIGIVARGHAAVEASLAAADGWLAVPSYRVPNVRTIVQVDPGAPTDPAPTDPRTLPTTHASAPPYECAEASDRLRGVEILRLLSGERHTGSAVANCPGTQGFATMGLTIVGTSQEDAMRAPTDSLFRRYATAFLAARLHCNKLLGQWLDPESPELRNDQTSGAVNVWRREATLNSPAAWCRP